MGARARCSAQCDGYTEGTVTALAAPNNPTPEPEESWIPRIVVVDDDRLVVSMLEDLFVQEGHDVRGFTSSVDAKAYLQKEPVDLVITDLKMPEVSGLDLLREIRAQSNETQVIIITGYASLQTTLEAVSLGAFDYLTKPFMVDEVRLVVKRGIEQIQLQRENNRLAQRVEDLEGDFTRLMRKFEALTQEFNSVTAQGQSIGPSRMIVPRAPIEAIKPYEQAAQTRQSRYTQRIELLRDLLNRGVLSENDFENAKRKLAESTGAGA